MLHISLMFLTVQFMAYSKSWLICSLSCLFVCLHVRGTPEVAYSWSGCMRWCRGWNCFKLHNKNGNDDLLAPHSALIQISLGLSHSRIVLVSSPKWDTSLCVHTRIWVHVVLRTELVVIFPAQRKPFERLYVWTCHSPLIYSLLIHWYLFLVQFLLQYKGN